MNILHMFKITSGKLPGNFRKLPGMLETDRADHVHGHNLRETSSKLPGTSGTAIKLTFPPIL